MNPTHTPVLTKEVVTGLDIKPQGIYIDATLGAGGHSRAILEQGGQVIGIDQDPQAISEAKKNLKKYRHITYIPGNFNNLKALVAQKRVNQVDGIVFDLGVSSMQLDTAQRGFSFQQEAPLDMRMSPQVKSTAQDLVNSLEEEELYEIFKKYGGEQQAGSIAAAIVSARQHQAITTTQQLTEIIVKAMPIQSSNIHPATKVFQALRIAVNQELDHLGQALPQAVDLMKPEGRLAVISFHDGEDRIVKHFINQEVRLNSITKKPITPSPAEVKTNPRARSAKLRLAEKAS